MHQRLQVIISAGETKQMVKSHEQTENLVGVEISKRH